jgi:Tol biopolymer transport system component
VSDMSDIDRVLDEWFDRAAASTPPPALIDIVLEQTAHTSRRRAWPLYAGWAWSRAAVRIAPPGRAVVLLGCVVLVMMVVVVALLAGARRPPVPAPFGLAANGRIAFVVDGQLVTADPDGRNVRRAATGTGEQGAPTFSRDGTRILYRDFLGPTVETSAFGSVPVEDVVVADADGSHPRVVVHNVAAGSPEWSPDSRWISYGAADMHAYVVSSDGSTPPVDLGSFGPGAWTPSWAPDSTRVVVAVLDGSLWVANRDGSGARRVSHGTYAEASDGAWSADWSPDGTKLLFAAGDPSVRMDLYLLGLDGSAETQVAKDSNDGVWSPDGSAFAYLTGSTRGGTVLTIADAAGREIRTLGTGYGWFMPAWSPDGTKVAVLDDSRGQGGTPGPPVIVILDIAGTAPPVVVPAGSRVFADDRPAESLAWQRVAP